MNNKYFKLRLFQSAFLLFFMLGMSMTAFTQSGSSGSGSGSNSGDCCDQGGKPEQITFRYVGGSCSSSTDSQGSKFDCDGGSATAGSVYIEVDDFFDGTVNLGETFTLDSDGDKFDSGTEIIIRTSQGGSRLQTLDFHTSCSAPIVPGEQFGALLLERVVFDNGLVCTPPAPPEECPLPSISAPTSPVISTSGNFCTNQPVTFSAPDLGFPCLEYTWNFGANASPQTFVGNGPISVTFSTIGSRQISLTIDNNCTDNGNGGNNSGSGSSGSGSSGSGSGSNNSGSGSGSSGSSGSSSSGNNSFVNLVICPQGGVNNNSGSGSSGSGSSGSGSGSNNSGSGSGSSGSSGSGSSSNNNGGNGNEACVPCRRTVSITINVENCNQPNPSMIGDMVFNDLNGNGIMNNGEPGISGVTVTLSKDNGQFIGQATSDFFGKYKFNNVMPNMSYKLTYTNLPAGFSFTTQNQGGNEDNDSDANPSTGMTDPIFINPGDMRLDQDVGLVQGNPNQASVGDKVFADNNGNGIQNNGEPGIGGVTVKLQDSNGNTLQQTTTSGDGSYSFTGLTQGLYKVMFNTPNGFVITMPKQGGNDERDSDVQNNQMTNAFFVGEGQTLTNIDAGYIPSQPNNGIIGDRVFADNNNNGQQDNGEPGIGGVTVKLQDSNGNTLQTTTTSGNGSYSFTGLVSGNYKVMFNTPNGFTQSPANVGNDATDSDNQSNQMTDPFFLGSGEVNNTIDAGFVPDQPNTGASIGDKVFVDNNGNGIQNGNEPGISGVTVKLQDLNGTILQQTTTNGSGNYSFTGLDQGLYKVMFNTPNGFVITMPKQGGNDANDSDVQNTQMTNPFYLGENQDRTDIDAGYIPDQSNNNASVGDRVFADNNNNGQQDNGEPGIGGVTVKLQDSNGNTLQTTTTGGDGSYGFTGLAAGNYKVMFNTPNGFTQSPANVGNDATDSDNQSNQMTDPFFLSDGENNPTIDAGFVPIQPNNGSIGDKVFADNNNNGQQDNGEPGIGGVTVKLQDSNGNTLQTTTTNGNGKYQFNNVPQGSYKVMVNIPNNFNAAPMNVGNDATDSDIGANGMTNVFFLNQGQNDPTVDAGLVPQGNTGKASVGDRTFRDNNGNGIQDPGEPGVPGVYVQLNDSNGSFIAFKITDQNGQYQFTDLDPGTYQLKMVGQPGDLIPSPKDQSSNDSEDSDINLLGFTDFFTLSAGENNPTLDGGFSPRDAVPQGCEITATISNVQCDGNTYSFDVTVNGSNTGDWGWDIGEFGLFTQNYGTTRRITGVSGSKTIVVRDHDIAGCETTVTVNPPNGCGDGGNTGGGTGTCSDINISGSNGQVTISGLTAAIEITKIFDANWNLIYECSGNCPSTVQENVNNGDYNVQVQFYTAQWGFICEKQERVTVGGGGDNGGGDNGGGDNGGGDSSGGDCNNINVQSGNGQITVSGWSAPVAIVKIFNPDYSLAKECTGNNCAGPITATGLAAGRYHIDIQLYTAGWQSICNFTQDVNMGGSSLVAPNTGTGLRLTNNNPQFSVYPNPATDELFVNMRNFVGKQGTIQVHNQIGQIVERIQVDKIPTGAVRVALNKLEGGLYYISAQVEGGAVMTQKIIVE